MPAGDARRHASTTTAPVSSSSRLAAGRATSASIVFVTCAVSGCSLGACPRSFAPGTRPRRSPPRESRSSRLRRRRGSALARAGAVGLGDAEEPCAHGTATACASARSRGAGVPAVRSRAVPGERHGVSVGEAGRRARIEWAAAAGRRRRLPLAEIAVEAGFADQSYFTRAVPALPRDDAGPVPGVPEPLDVQDSGGASPILGLTPGRRKTHACLHRPCNDGALARASRYRGLAEAASSPRRAAASTGRSQAWNVTASRSSTSRSPSRPGSTRTAWPPATSRTTRSSKDSPSNPGGWIRLGRLRLEPREDRR